MSEELFQRLLAFFKVLADASRLRIVGVLAEREASVGELAALLDLREPTVSHHLSRLRALGLVEVRVEGTTHHHRLAIDVLEDMSRELLSRDGLASLSVGVHHEAWEEKVLRTFFDAEQRLRRIPAGRKKRRVILEWLVERFASDTRYPEKEVNAVLLAHHWDSATLRRELVANGLMARERGVYWRV